MREGPIAIVCGYDRFSDLHLYAEQVASEIAAAGVGKIIVTGGFTSRDSYHSEAWVMSRVLAAKLPHAVVILEEWAMTTVDNLVFGRALAIEKFAADSYVVFCDQAHRIKAAVLTRIILGANSTVRTIPRTVSWRTLALEPVSIVFEAVCAVAPPLRKLLSRAAAWSKGVAHPLTTPNSRLTASPVRR